MVKTRIFLRHNCSSASNPTFCVPFSGVLVGGLLKRKNNFINTCCSRVAAYIKLVRFDKKVYKQICTNWQTTEHMGRDTVISRKRITSKGANDHPPPPHK
jgi:hypothetical protein